MGARVQIVVALAIALLFAASLAGGGLFQDEAVFALPWYGAAYHVLKTSVVGWWVSTTIARALFGDPRRVP